MLFYGSSQQLQALPCIALYIYCSIFRYFIRRFQHSSNQRAQRIAYSIGNTSVIR